MGFVARWLSALRFEPPQRRFDVPREGDERRLRSVSRQFLPHARRRPREYDLRTPLGGVFGKSFDRLCGRRVEKWNRREIDDESPVCLGDPVEHRADCGCRAEEEGAGDLIGDDVAVYTLSLHDALPI